jgi:hypothetical protein
LTATYHFVMGWKEFIAKVLGEYLLAGALVTVAAVGIYFQLERTWGPRKTPCNLLLTLIGWAVVVPIVGFFLEVAGEANSFSYDSPECPWERRRSRRTISARPAIRRHSWLHRYIG